VPAGERLLEPHLRDDLTTVTFGDGGDVILAAVGDDGQVYIVAGEHIHRMTPSFLQPHNLNNLLAAVAAARAIGVNPQADLEVKFSALRGDRRELAGRVVVFDDCYNANPMSVSAALDDLTRHAGGRTVAVLGDMLELGHDELSFHREVGAHAALNGVDLVIAVGPLAAAIGDTFSGELHAVADAQTAAHALAALVQDGDTVLVKGSRGVGLEIVTPALERSLLVGRD
jgi:UDP-N-acetylmuramoyl-tripeptide--D-alanyl-D-alanine ligase